MREGGPDGLEDGAGEEEGGSRPVGFYGAAVEGERDELGMLEGFDRMVGRVQLRVKRPRWWLHRGPQLGRLCISWRRWRRSARWA